MTRRSRLLFPRRRPAGLGPRPDVSPLPAEARQEIARHALAPVLQNHPDLAAAITAKVMERRGSLDDARRVEEEEEHESVLSRIRAYFRL